MNFGINSDFDLEELKKNYPQYLKVVIDEEGNVHNAVPSHQEYLIKECKKQLNCSLDKLMKKVPKEYYCDMIEWLSIQSKCVAVWHDFCIGKINDKQYETLKKLKLNGLYRGRIIYDN